MSKKADSKTLKRLLSYISQYRIQFIFVLVSILLSAVASVVSTLFLKTLIDDYITPLLLEAVPDFSGLARLILIMAGIYLIGVIATLFYNRVMVVIAQGVLKEIRDEMFEKMQKLPIRYFDTHSHGDIMSHYTNDTDTLRQMLTQSIPQLFSSVVTIVAVFVSMLTLSLWLTIFVVLFTFIILKVVGNITSKSSKYFVSQQKSLGDVNGYIEEMINGQKVVKVFCHEDKAKELFNQKNEELCKNATEANRFANMLGPLMNNMGYILYVSMAIVGGGLAILGVTNVSLSGVGTLTLGMIASFLQLSRSFIMPLSQVSQQLSSIVMAIAGAGRIFELIDEKWEEDEGYVTLVNVNKVNGELIETKEHSHHWAWKHPHSDRTVTYTELKGEVRFFDVDFGYNEEKIVLHNISLYAEPGQKIAFVGATGAGKTTITNLINRFYDIADGKIRYDGININKIKKDDLRRSLGIVLQDVNLFTGTVMENIRYGRLDATDKECIEAAKLANADGFIRMLPDGYNTIISGDGSDLSQGQRQLISIARAAVADPPVMILDEATSSIDTHTESIVQRGMDSLMEGRTVFVIAHRLSTVKNSDVIMVLEKGRIIERGSHESLIKEKGKYYQLYTGAFELE
ncbi:ABC transporter ATP-binding protein [Clostridium paraputrificum]|nr:MULTISPECIES: ABC transporter ATP-binding protein [Clostridium]MDB2076446.1 ABC transporter ATP-binding protein [Clostridium paraputrificum]MDB2079104.1 ABC transporter ATP-binding protein [Clostridium paraputrificum]MDB2086037.1 ABC transporter ATP-binding protein [Clostridium paraputrificum]MDB2091157.1 ABC transporter ATP-binding protein [Clostridium paraputrificum]MDB2100631.1 ABC transporter ATP-binding protein [Clostridium paraputrificum]